MKKYTTDALVSIMHETFDYIKQDKKHFTTFATKFTQIKQINKKQINKKQINKKQINKNPDFITDIIIENIDTLDATSKYSIIDDETYTFLDMASSNPDQFGGDYLIGAMSQEEELCRRTSLTNCFNLVSPPVPETGAIFCEEICIIREGSEKNYEFINKDEQVCANCIMVCAIKKPKLNFANEFVETDMQLTMTKIKTMLEILVNKEQYYLVLGAFGCDSYLNPPSIIANIFKYYLLGQFKGHFKRIIFAIVDTKLNENYNIFKEVFQNDNILDFNQYDINDKENNDDVDIKISKQINKEKKKNIGKMRDKKFKDNF